MLTFERIVKIADLAEVPVTLVLSFLQSLSDGLSHRVLDVTRDTGIPKSALKILMAELSDAISPDAGDACIATQSGLDAIKHCLEERAAAVRLSEQRLPLALDLLERLERSRPRSDRELDQFRATSQTSCARAQLLMKLQTLDNRRVAFLGDNDLTSIACTILGSPSRLVAFDIDKKVLEAIASVDLSGRTSIECVPYNARESMPKKYSESFDIIVTDPPFTVDGVRLFLSRAADLISQSGEVFLSYGFSLRARERGLAVQQAIVEMGWLIYQVWPGFNEYYAAGSIGARSNLYHLLSTPQTKPSIKGSFRGPIYTGRS